MTTLGFARLAEWIDGAGWALVIGGVAALLALVLSRTVQWGSRAHQSNLMFNPVVEKIKYNWPNSLELEVLNLRPSQFHHL